MLNQLVEHQKHTEQQKESLTAALDELANKTATLSADLEQSPETIAKGLQDTATTTAATRIGLEVVERRLNDLKTKLKTAVKAANSDHEHQRIKHKQERLGRASELMSGEQGDHLRQQILALCYLDDSTPKQVVDGLFAKHPEGYEQQESAARALNEYIEPPVKSEVLQEAEQIIFDARVEYGGLEVVTR